MKKNILIVILLFSFIIRPPAASGTSFIGGGFNVGTAYPNGTVSEGYRPSFSIAYGINLKYEYRLTEYFHLMTGLSYEYRPIPLKYKFPNRKKGNLTIKQYLAGINIISRFFLSSFFGDLGVFYAVKGGPGKYQYTGEYSADGSIHDFDHDAKETFPFGIIIGAGRIFSITERTTFELSIRYAYELTSQYENPDSNWKMKAHTVCLNIGMNYAL